ncbi:hypothetical protein HY968_04230 [Candidatus Kaiserbacteria bacterium]|nr:hypothetical protein [Candidatus Kaiserbacteria bacterium]
MSLEQQNSIEEIGAQMPLLDKAVELFPNTDLSGFSLVSCHHILRTNVPVLQKLFEKGLKPENAFVLGKPYSTEKSALEEYKKLGVHVSAASVTFDSTDRFDSFFGKAGEVFVRQALQDAPADRKLLVWDDGGILLRPLAGESQGREVRAVEHTSSGHNALQNINLPFPVVNMARSKTKLELESPFIVEDVLGKFAAYLRAHPSKKVRKILVVGGGAIGANFKKDLTIDGYNVTTFDTIAEKSDHEHLEQIIGDFDAIIGTTGSEVLSADKINLLKHDAVVFSASSSDREFDALGWRSLSNVSVAEHSDIEVAGRVLLNNGFPLNFNGSPDTIPPQAIQLTRALSLASMFLAADDSSANKKGWLEIPRDIQDALAKKFGELMQANL